jgi:type IV fimbrial biogenesis protein FimT
MNRNRGFTLVEFMIVITIVAIGVALAVPSFSDMIERKALGGAAEAAYEQLQRARSQAVKRSKPIVVDFYEDGTDWAIGFTDKTSCNAESIIFATGCSVEYNNDNVASDRLLMRIVGSDYKNITMRQVTPGFSGSPRGCTTADNAQACFDFVRGLARTGQYDFESANYKLRVEVTLLGNVNICVPSGEKQITGYRGC